MWWAHTKRQYGRLTGEYLTNQDNLVFTQVIWADFFNLISIRHAIDGTLHAHVHMWIMIIRLRGLEMKPKSVHKIT